MTAPALILAAPMTGSGKTVAMLGLLGALRRRGLEVASFKVGPDFLDPAFHAAITGRPSLNLDSWAMRFSTLVGLLEQASQGADLLLGEGMMGLADGAPDGSGTTGDLAALLDLPVLFVVDCAKLGGSVAPLVEGFLRWREEVEICGLLLDRVAGEEHAALLIEACEARFSTRILGWLPEDPRLELPSRHLGLVQPEELSDLAAMLEHAADLVGERVDLDRLLRLARPPSVTTLERGARPIPPLGQRIAVARDVAFAFAYPATLEGWRAAGAELLFFSPLADEPPDPRADAVYLPGGYPELHAARLGAGEHWRAGLAAAAARGAFVYGECGGYMALGETLVDSEGRAHPMAGLLPLVTSLADPAPRIGWRRVQLAAAGPLGPEAARYRGHEFHLAREIRRDGPAFAETADARGRALGATGCRIGNVAGSFVHLIDREERG
ncbi:MAG: cobyrinate a,c-diamide synthase [Geminicoccaceae bacterium]|nr:cobyrinate a,c-diamide synthase [Geminicoccaceae bacterium]MCX8099722.1 cobyrinate a,c-diamide synthase [Geminicoccaceae bacterium]MDW8369071.1 cobyrinate a,c-diamide synthase [Geminicoccaceae bacterium]